MAKLTRHIPNTMTLFNVGVGLAAIFLAISGEYGKSAGLILVSVIVDTFDGYVARMLQSTSKFGGYMDTVSDFLAFAIAASILMVKAYDVNFVIGGIFLLSSVLRLLIFMKTKNPQFFWGVPTTVSGGLIATLVILRPASLPANELSVWMSALMIILSLLMLSKRKYYRVEIRRRRTITLLVAVFMSLFAVNSMLLILILSLMFLTYIAFGWLRISEVGTYHEHVRRMRIRKRRDKRPDEIVIP
jgi:CDP-diacylglycerol---serine O-phosphatidyltransferase